MSGRQLALLPGLQSVAGSPCKGCPLDDGTRQKVPPHVPAKTPLLGVVGLGSGLEEQTGGAAFVGRGGEFLRRELNAVGFSAGTIKAPRAEAINVVLANLTRCRPDDNNFEGVPWKRAARHCWEYLVSDLAGKYPLLLFGTEPTQAFLRNPALRVSSARGLWYHTPEGRLVMPTWHPAYVLREVRQHGEGSVVLQQFRSDLKRMADRVLRNQPLTPPPVAVTGDP